MARSPVSPGPVSPGPVGRGPVSRGPVGRGLRLWPLAVVLIGVLLGLVLAVIGEQTWRIGSLLIGTSLLVGAVIRGALQNRDAGLLQVRSRAFDLAVLTLGGIAIIALSIVVPGPPR